MGWMVFNTIPRVEGERERERKRERKRETCDEGQELNLEP
jgi:hypothetical protein